MRKIQSEEERVKRESRNKLVLGLLLIMLMLASTAGYALYGRTESGSPLDQGQIKEGFDGIYWNLPRSYSTLSLLSDPSKLTLVELAGNAKFYSGAGLFIDSDNQLVLQHLASNLQSYFTAIQEACYDSCSRDLPEKDCSQPIVIYRESENKEIRQEENCFFINGGQEEVDTFLLSFVK